ncbi:hypothetical protein NHF46_20260 [Arthrobacter alpinus]|nr:hypothetical protein [Arthrobacter alpinus]
MAATGSSMAGVSQPVVHAAMGEILGGVYAGAAAEAGLLAGVASLGRYASSGGYAEPDS